MSQKNKLLAAIRHNPKDVRFDDIIKAAEWIGFVGKPRNGGSHCAMARKGEQTQLNFQNRNGLVKPYQVKQFIVMLDKYGEEDT